MVGGEITYPVCSWADGNTGASVERDAADVDVEAFAEWTLQVRSEIRQRIS